MRTVLNRIPVPGSLGLPVGPSFVVLAGQNYIPIESDDNLSVVIPSLVPKPSVSFSPQLLLLQKKLCCEGRPGYEATTAMAVARTNFNYTHPQTTRGLDQMLCVAMSTTSQEAQYQSS